MSRQLPPAQRPRVPPIPESHYQGAAASTLPLSHFFNKHQPQPNRGDINCHLQCTGSIRGNPCNVDLDACFTDEAFTEHNYYEFDEQDYDHGYQTRPGKTRHDAGLRTDASYSDESDRLEPYHEYDEIASRRFSRNNYSERGGSNVIKPCISPAKEGRQVYPLDGGNRVFPNGVQVCLQEPPVVVQAGYPRRGGHLSRMSGESGHTLGSDVPSAVIYGCGGKCPTFENVCYYFLQVAFTMGILIGISLGIAGWVLRKSAARNLQVLLYIGAMLSLVCALLLAIQCNARNTARMRQKALRNAKRAPIQMDMLTSNVLIQQQQQQYPLMEANTIQRGVPVTLTQAPGSGPVLQVQRCFEPRQQVIEQPGIPWWRRKDLQ